MSRLPSRRHAAATAAIVVGLVLLAPCAALAQPPGTGTPSFARISLAAPAELLTRAWSVVSRLWDGTGTTANRQLALSSPALDEEPPYPVAASGSTPPLENGCGLDPDGHCRH